MDTVDPLLITDCVEELLIVTQDQVTDMSRELEHSLK